MDIMYLRNNSWDNSSEPLNRKHKKIKKCDKKLGNQHTLILSSYRCSKYAVPLQKLQDTEGNGAQEKKVHK